MRCGRLLFQKEDFGVWSAVYLCALDFRDIMRADPTCLSWAGPEQDNRGREGESGGKEAQLETFPVD